MSQIMYNYPAMIAHAGEMSSYAGGALHAVGADIASEQAALQGAWQGGHRDDLPGMAGPVEHQLEELVRAYRAMASTHEMNTTSMAARDQAEGAKWADRSSAR